MSEQSVDDRADIRQHLDFTKAEWIRAEPKGATVDDCIEYAFIGHTDGVTYTAMRVSTDPDSVLVFTPSVWREFVAGVIDGEFDLTEEIAKA
ncbi:DUF397 domain-containing protein [Amycolatopsis sp. WAC 04197]|uniref:DUF397 domain-containing protein n=1 Tax=unclassified Amycolatopsis TaxID=2618356 RepID=UPI000F769557|nr:DUF397 domain-containing protein [Amycolatopsis sp. WAC 04197]RSN39106.1 DUF397 domain-containing protein [Amycolatopsis sp. WAC 04197]